jgi:hypothetical protein
LFLPKQPCPAEKDAEDNDVDNINVQTGGFRNPNTLLNLKLSIDKKRWNTDPEYKKEMKKKIREHPEYQKLAQKFMENFGTGKTRRMQEDSRRFLSWFGSLFGGDSDEDSGEDVVDDELSDSLVMNSPGSAKKKQQLKKLMKNPKFRERLETDPAFKAKVEAFLKKKKRRFASWEDEDTARLALDDEEDISFEKLTPEEKAERRDRVHKGFAEFVANKKKRLEKAKLEKSKQPESSE